jgi:AraC family transcriptional regulator, arabinose operon regulatory protein
MVRMVEVMDDPAGDAVPSPRVEAIHPEVDRLLAGGFTADAAYSTWREAGTDDWLLIHTVAGSGVVRGVAGGIRVRAGDAVLLAPRVRHDYRTDTDEWAILFAHFHPRPHWAPLLDWPRHVDTVGTLHTDGDIRDRVESALRTASGSGVGMLAQAELFAENALEAALLWLDTQNPHSHPRGGGMDERVIRVMEHVGAHLDGDLSLDALARVAHVSASRLSHLFTAALGTSPQRFVEHERLERAARLLDFTDRAVGDIARSAGWADPLYFTRRFTRRFGLSPTAYRSSRR